MELTHLPQHDDGASGDPHRDFAIAAITRHIAEHPLAADTLEGIHMWWVGAADAGEHGHAPSSETTLAALEELARRGLLEVLRVGSRLVWRHPGTAQLNDHQEQSK